MKLEVEEHGVTVPKDLFDDADAVDVRVEKGRVILEPISRSAGRGEGAITSRPDHQDEDPILGLGRDPVPCGTSDASEHHDRYLYGK